MNLTYIPMRNHTFKVENYKVYYQLPRAHLKISFRNNLHLIYGRDQTEYQTPSKQNFVDHLKLNICSKMKKQINISGINRLID